MIVVVVLLALALAGAALLVGSRLVAPTTPSLTDVSIFVRRDDGPDPGVSVYAVRPDGREVLVRKVPDSIVPAYGPLRGTLSVWGAVSASGWLALHSEVKPWPMILIDLGDAQAKPWVIDEANTGGISPRWGPTGLVAADAGGNGGRVVIVDPETHTTRIVNTRGLVGGGPSIVWASDGSGIIGFAGNGAYEIVPLDDGYPRAGAADVFDPRGLYGPGLSELRICSPGASCPGGDDGRIERVELDGSARTIWQQEGDDRALAASFGSRADEYWLSVDHDKGRARSHSYTCTTDARTPSRPSIGLPTGRTSAPRPRPPTGQRSWSGSTQAPSQPRPPFSCRSAATSRPITPAPSQASSTPPRRPPSPRGARDDRAESAGRGRGLCLAVARRADRRRAEHEPGSHGARTGIARRG